MRAVTYQSVLEGVLKRRSVAVASVQAERVARVAEFIADRMHSAWEYYAWPFALDVEERFFRAEWSAAAYASGAEIYHAGTAAYYRASAAALSTDVPGVAAVWVKLTTLRRYVALEQVGKTAIDAVVGMWATDPRASSGAARVSYTISGDGAEISPDYVGTSVWVRYRRRAPELAWSATWSAAAFAAGAVVYKAPGVYRASAAALSTDVPGVAAVWVLQEVPFALARAVKAGAAADDLGAGGGEEKAALEDVDFVALLEEQVWQLTKLQGQTGQVAAEI